jgi:hypothetical protein
MRKAAAGAVVFLAGLTVFEARAAVPEVVSFQGRLSDANGIAVADDDYAVTFRMYDAAMAGNKLWQEQQTVTVKGGVFSALLGSATAFPAGLFDSQRWLSLEVGTDGEMTPRFRLASAPYALTAKHAETAGDAATLDGAQVGTADGDIVAVQPSGMLPALDGSQLTGVVAVDSDKVDGIHASEFADTVHTHSSLDGDAGGLAQALYVDASGNVGIGTTTPAATLEVNGATRVGSLTVAGSLDLEDTSDIRSYTAGPFDFNKDVTGAGNFTIGDWRYIAATSAGYAWAPVHLPDGAVVTEMEARVSDQEASGHVEVDLGYHGLWMAHVETSDAYDSGQTTVTDTTIDLPTVNGSLRYYVRAYFSSGGFLYVNWVTIRYYMPQLP